MPGVSVQATDLRAVFPRPVLLAPNVAFWTDAFSKISEYQSVIHFQDQPHKIYAVLDFRDDAVRLGPAAARRAQSRAEVATKREIDKHLKRVHALRATPEKMSADEKKLHDLLADVDGANRYKDAVGRFRSQRGLKEKTERALKVSGQYLPKMEAIFAAEGLPVLLTRLPLVESSFNVEAYSKVGAAGLWQFIPSSARIYMRLDEAVDDRRDPWTSTQAAARHLKEDYAALGNWPLAITAYNHGRAGLAKGLREVKGDSLEDLLARWDGRRFGFASRNFYAEFLAAIDVEQDHRDHFGEIQKHDPIEFDVVQIQHYVSYAALQQCAGLDDAQFRLLNPGYRPEVLDGRLFVPPQTSIRVPVGAGEKFMNAYLSLDASQRFDQQRFYYVRYRVQKGDNLGAIARRYGVRVTDLKQANGIGNKTFIRAGQVLKIPPRGGARTLKVAAAKDDAAPPAPGVTDFLTHQVRPGQSLTSIARQYRTTIDALRQLNGFDEAYLLKAGAVVKVPSY
ncbi:MAG TPA: LysM peptidoglycan-binding domain-containing protein [Verrucomicrobiae bacterium]|nr:LysM peptidoglycan-binding domain-containing protein [Verrucomicrobiae bacterium]